MSWMRNISALPLILWITDWSPAGQDHKKNKTKNIVFLFCFVPAPQQKSHPILHLVSSVPPDSSLLWPVSAHRPNCHSTVFVLCPYSLHWTQQHSQNRQTRHQRSGRLRAKICSVQPWAENGSNKQVSTGACTHTHSALRLMGFINNNKMA